jgi:hypothetical protein
VPSIPRKISKENVVVGVDFEGPKAPHLLRVDASAKKRAVKF